MTLSDWAPAHSLGELSAAQRPAPAGVAGMAGMAAWWRLGQVFRSAAARSASSDPPGGRAPASQPASQPVSQPAGCVSAVSRSARPGCCTLQRSQALLSVPHAESRLAWPGLGWVGCWFRWPGRRKTSSRKTSSRKTRRARRGASVAGVQRVACGGPPSVRLPRPSVHKLSEEDAPRTSGR